MVELKLERPYINSKGVEMSKYEKHYAEDEKGTRYKILQVETGTVYDEAVDLYPCKYTYEVTEELVETTVVE